MLRYKQAFTGKGVPHCFCLEPLCLMCSCHHQAPSKECWPPGVRFLDLKTVRRITSLRANCPSVAQASDSPPSTLQLINKSPPVCTFCLLLRGTNRGSSSLLHSSAPTSCWSCPKREILTLGAPRIGLPPCLWTLRMRCLGPWAGITRRSISNTP